jgi:hypothetical protein
MLQHGAMKHFFKLNPARQNKKKGRGKCFPRPFDA